MSDPTYILRDGITLAVDSFGTGVPLIYAHGLTGSRTNSALQLAPLADSHRILVFDQRGHGASSPVTDPAGYSPEAMADDIAAILDHYGIEQAVVGGESMGAATALLFALRHPGRTCALLLTGPAFADVPNPNADSMRAIGRSVARLGMEQFVAQAATGEWRTMGLSARAIERWATVLRSHRADSLAAACAAVPEWCILPDLAPLAGLHCPVQVIGWPDDPSHPLDLAQRLVEALPAGELMTLQSLTYLFNKVETPGVIFRRFLERQASSGPI